MSYNDYSNYNYRQDSGYGPDGYPGGYQNRPQNRPHNRPQNRNQAARRSAQAEKYRRAAMKRNALMAALALFFVAEIIVIALLATSLSKKPGKETEPKETTATSESTVPTTTTTTETTPQITVSEKLPPNSLADNYWGPLPVCESPKAYKHFEVKGLYTRAAVNLDKCIQLASGSELNSFVVDLKESEGI